MAESVVAPAYFFSGTYAHTLDSKGRVSLPAKFRKDLPVALKLVPRKNAVWVFSIDGFNAWFSDFFRASGGSPSSSSDDDDEMVFTLMATVEDAEIDTAGRISISAALREFAGLEKEVKVVGCYNHLEIMSPEAYAARMAKRSA